MSTALAVQNGRVAVEPYIDREKIELIKNTILKGATDLELQMFLNLCETKRLDPLSRQIYCIRQRNGSLQMFPSIDGLRVIAERTGNYGGQTEPYWCGPDGVWRDVWLDDGAPSAAKVGVWKRGYEHPTWGVATFKSYGAGKANNWTSMPDVMLAKCAEALALRKAFPQDMSGLYIREEFGDTETPELQHNAPQFSVTPAKSAPVIAEVIDASTGEVQTPKETADQKKLALGIAIKELRESLGWDAERVRQEAAERSLSLNSVAGLMAMVTVLQEYVATAKAQAQDDDEEDYEALEAEAEAAEQPTLLDADVAPISRGHWDD